MLGGRGFEDVLHLQSSATNYIFITISQNMFSLNKNISSIMYSTNRDIVILSHIDLS